MRHNSVNNSGMDLGLLLRVIDAISHGVAATHLNGNGIFLHKPSQLHAEGNHISVNMALVISSR